MAGAGARAGVKAVSSSSSSSSTATAPAKKQLIFREEGLDFLCLKRTFFRRKKAFRDLRVPWIS